MLERLQEVPFDRAAARDSARIRLELERRGNVIGPLDLLIAGRGMWPTERPTEPACANYL
jgi:predicted nucleic acid-binding protein